MAIREIPVEEITKAVRRLCIEANTILGKDIIDGYRSGLEMEKSPVGKDIFRQLLENAEIAERKSIPLCQDTGLAVVFVEIGQDVHISGGDINQAINDGVRQGYRDGFLRASSRDPITGKNTGDNTPAIIHVEIVSGKDLKLIVMPKGFGSEN
ncbi:fumarate hydratase, partial [bacterium]|nr:fumarate hydratase [bacterium]